MAFQYTDPTKKYVDKLPQVDLRPEWQKTLSNVQAANAGSVQAPVTGDSLTYGRTALGSGGSTGPQMMLPMATPSVQKPIVQAPAGQTGGGTSTQVLAPAAPFVPNWAQTPTPKQPAPGSNAAAWAVADNETQAEKDARAILENTSQNIDPQALYQQRLAQYQSEIDAQNNLYNDMLNQSRINNAPEYLRRANQTASLAVSQGLTGSNVGQGMANQTADANMAQQAAAEALINEKRANAIAAIKKEVRQSSEAEYTANVAARRSGAEAIIENSKSRLTKRLDIAAKAIKGYLAAGVDLEHMTDEEQKKYLGDLNLDEGQVKAILASESKSFKDTKASNEAEATKSAADLAYKQAQTAKDIAETAQIGKMTPYQSASLKIEERRLAQSSAGEKEITSNAVNAMANEISQALDVNGYLTPSQYKEARDQWVAQTQLEPSVFDTYFADKAYTNEVDKKSKNTLATYGIVQRKEAKQ